MMPATMTSTRAIQTDNGYTNYLRAIEDHPTMRVEWIEGEIVISPAPQPIHQSISDNLVWLLHQHVRTNKLGKILEAPLDVELAAKASIVQPDLIFIRRERVKALMGERRITGAPDLVVEILSPATAYHDRYRKLRLYAHHGVAEYWIVDIDNQVVEVYTLEDQHYQVAGIFLAGEKIDKGQFAAAQIAVDEIFTE